MSKKAENEPESSNTAKEESPETKGESEDSSEKAESVEQQSTAVEPAPPHQSKSSREINLDLIEERRKTLSEEHEKLLANNRVLQEEVLRLKSKIDKLRFASQVLSTTRVMEELKRRVKGLIPEEKHMEIDKIFCDWIAGLKVHTILEKDAQGEVSKEENHRKKEDHRKEEEREEREREESDLPQDKVPLKCQIEELKKQIEEFKRKMKMYKESNTSTTDLALSEVKEEIGRVREGIVRMRMNFAKDEDSGKDSENAELIQKLDEVKQFLEKLK